MNLSLDLGGGLSFVFDVLVVWLGLVLLFEETTAWICLACCCYAKLGKLFGA